MLGIFRLTAVLFVTVGLFAALSGCEKKTDPRSPNFVEWNGKNISRTLSSDGVEFKVVSMGLLNARNDAPAPGNSPAPTASPTATATPGAPPAPGNSPAPTPTPTATPDDSSQTALVLGFPRQLIGQENVFGGVVTAVSDHEDQSLGGLKLSDLPALHVKTELSADGASLVLNGCKEECEEGSARPALFKIPVVSQDANFVFLDLKSFGAGLDFVKEAIPDAGVNALASKVTRFDFSLSTLVFDVENTYSLDALRDPDSKSRAPFTLTVRWYLKLASGFHSDFTSRKQRPEAGFFTTARSKNEVITRFSFSTTDASIAKYYIKNVPAQYHAAFADSFEDWNKNLAGVVGRKMFEYEFIDQGDPRANEIVAGDVRYNVIEWDLVNKAGYGGLGPSIANQMTGETFSANVLIQGPTVMVLYKKWWRVSEAALALEANGQPLAAQKLRADFMAARQALARPSVARPASAFALSLKHELPFQIRSADPRLYDPMLDEMDFFDRPAGYTFDTYMYGYFRDMVAHELGHNIGLRHNFRGSLGGNASGTIGSVSRSVMEYLNRNFRYLDRVGPYDQMAIAYGYRGTTPEHKDWFCTDEDVVSADNFTHSAECSPNDGGTDPFGFFLAQFRRAKEFLILPGSEQAPVWTVGVLGKQVTAVVKELANYYVSSFATAGQWTNFSTHGASLPTAEVPGYILKTLETEFCDPSIEAAIAQKTPEAQAVARKNLSDLVALVKGTTAEYSKPLSAFTEANFACFKGN